MEDELRCRLQRSYRSPTYREPEPLARPPCARVAPMTDGRELRTMRLRKGLDIAALAEALGVDPQTVEALERGELRPDEQLRDSWEAAIIQTRAPRPWWQW